MIDVAVPWDWDYDANSNSCRIQTPGQTVTIDYEELKRIIAEQYRVEMDKLVDIRDINIGDHVSFELSKDNFIRAYPIIGDFVTPMGEVRPSKPFVIQKNDSVAPPPDPPDIGDDFLDVCLG